jgi:formamidopyrimidine-DNA glycosylase
MPELPEVENERRLFARRAAGRTVVGVVVTDPTILRNVSATVLAASLRRRRFEEPARRGKWLLCPATGPTLVLHFGMTGELVWSGDDPDRHRYDRVILLLEEGELRYRNMRKLGGVWLARGPVELAAILGDVGPDALEVTEERFLSLLRRRRGGVKAALLDQGLVAGVGNLLADEILWQARLHPRVRIEHLTPRRRRELFEVMHRVLVTAVNDSDYVERRRDWLIHARGTPGATCPRCARALRHAVVAGRTTYSCPRCQRAPRR